MAVEFVGGGVEHPVEFEHSDAVLELEGPGEDREPLADPRLGLLGRLGDLAEAGLLLQFLRDGVELAECIRLSAGDRHPGRLHLRPGDLRDPPGLGADGQGLLDDQVDADHVRQHGILLPAQDVVDLLIDLLEVPDDLVHLLLHGALLHHRGQRSQGERAPQQGRRSLCDLEPLLDVARLADHRVAHTGSLGRHQPVLLDGLGRLSGQLHPTSGVRREVGTDLRSGPTCPRERPKAVKIEIPRRCFAEPG